MVGKTPTPAHDYVNISLAGSARVVTKPIYPTPALAGLGRVAYVKGVKKHTPTAAVPMMMAQLAIASWETMFYRSLMMAQGTCSLVEYQRMCLEKAAAAQSSAMAMLAGKGDAAVIAPYLSRARANARRLRKSV